MRPPGATRPDSSGASTQSGLVRMLATTRSKVSVKRLAASAPAAARRRCARHCRAAASSASLVDIDAEHVGGAELGRGECQDARTAAVIEHAFAAAANCRAQPFEAQARGRMRAGAEGQAGIEFQVDRRRVGRVRARRARSRAGR